MYYEKMKHINLKYYFIYDISLQGIVVEERVHTISNLKISIDIDSFENNIQSNTFIW